MRYDLISLGRSLDDLGTPYLTWVDVLAVVEQRRLDSALARALDGADAMWGLSEQLLAVIADRLAQMIWQNGGGKGPRPELIPRPGTKPKKTNVSSRRFDAMTVEQYERRYAARIASQQSKGGE